MLAARFTNELSLIYCTNIYFDKARRCPTPPRQSIEAPKTALLFDAALENVVLFMETKVAIIVLANAKSARSVGSRPTAIKLSVNIHAMYTERAINDVFKMKLSDN